MWILAALSVDALACLGDPDDPRWLLAHADRVYRARITEMWDLHDRPQWNAEPWDLDDRMCEPIVSRDMDTFGSVVLSLEVRQVWKGDVAPVLYLPESGWYTYFHQVGDIDTFFDAMAPGDGRPFSVVSNCGWDPSVDLGPPRYTHPYEPTAEEVLWEAIAADDIETVVQVLAVLPAPTEIADWEFLAGLEDARSWSRLERFVPRCPPEAYDLLVLSRYRSLAALETCPAERIFGMLPWLSPDDPEWHWLLPHLDADMLSALASAGVQATPEIANVGLSWSLMEGRADAARWWLAHGAQYELCCQDSSTALDPELYELLDRYGAHPTCLRTQDMVTWKPAGAALAQPDSP